MPIIIKKIMGESIFFHIDIDAFFASVEQLDHPEYKGLPVIVGGQPNERGVVSTCSYEARNYGIHSAMPVAEAYRRCPQGIFLPVRMHRYSEVSKAVFKILEDYTPDVYPISIDEACLDMKGMMRLFGSSQSVARTIKDRVKNEVGLCISIGVGPNRYIAKIASGINKPDGLLIIKAEEVSGFMVGLPLQKLWGAGKKTQEKFSSLGIHSIKELQTFSLSQLQALFGKAGGGFLYNAARGIESRSNEKTNSTAIRKSLGSEITFSKDIRTQDELERHLLAISEKVSYRIWAEHLHSSTVRLKIRFSDFSTISKCKSFGFHFQDSNQLYGVALQLLKEVWDGKKAVRLLGLSLTQLHDKNDNYSADLFGSLQTKREKAENSVFAIEESGLGKITKARLLGDK